jgi:hypothetical protein
MQGPSHWLQDHAIGITLLATFLLLPLGLALLMMGTKESRRRDVGIALVTGGCFTLASLLVQLTLEKSNFTMTISVTDDLTGFDASGRVLEETTLAGKNLYRANLKEARLKKADLSTANLTEARLQDADLRGANLSYAVLLRANLSKANLRDANLIGAELSTSSILSVRDLRGAKVHRETCWHLTVDSQPRWLSEDRAVASAEDQPILDRLTTAGLVAKDGKTLGHACSEYEETRPLGKQTGEPEPDLPRVYICQDGSLRLGGATAGDGVCN